MTYETLHAMLSEVGEDLRFLSEVELPDYLDSPGCRPSDCERLAKHLMALLDLTLDCVGLVASWGLYKRALENLGVEE